MKRRDYKYIFCDDAAKDTDDNKYEEIAREPLLEVDKGVSLCTTGPHFRQKGLGQPMSIMCVLIAFMCGEKKALKTLQKFFEMVDPIHPNETIPTQIKANMYSFHFIRECIIAPCYYVLQRLIKLRICECVILDKIWDKKTKDHVLQMIQESGKDLNKIRDFKDFRVVRKALDTTQYMESSRGLDTRFSGLSRRSKFVMFSHLIQDVFETIVDYGMRPKLRNHSFFVDSGEPLPTRPNNAL